MTRPRPTPKAEARARVGILVIGVLVAATGCTRSEPSRGLSPHLRAFLERYFESWSAGDMATYRSLFHDRATIVAVAGGRIAYCLGPEDFVHRQSSSQASRPMVERMTWVEAREDSLAAVARVGWHLTGPNLDVRGVDLFTLLRGPSGTWQITHLLFYQEP